MSTQPNTTDSTSQSFAGSKDNIIVSSISKDNIIVSSIMSSSSILIGALRSLLTQSVIAIHSSKIPPRYTREEEIKQVNMLKDLVDAIDDMWYENTPDPFNTNASQVTQVTASPRRSDCSPSEVSNHLIISLDLFTC